MSIAVVIPVYNHERFVGDAIRSVLAQTVEVQRIVVADDGSTDRSAEIVCGFSDSRIRLIEQKNAGAHAALNRAIAEADDCETIAILNSDDVFHPDRLQRCLEFFAQNRDKAVVVTRYEIIDAAGMVLPESDAKVRRARLVWSARHNSDSLAAWLGRANFAKTTSNLVCRRDYALAHPFREYRFIHDYFFVARAAIEGILGVIDSPLLFYRVHEANTIKASGSEAVTREMLQMQCDLLRDLAPSLRASQLAREHFTDYFCALMASYTDFRSPVFMTLLAEVLAELPREIVAARIQQFTAAGFPELSSPTSSRLADEQSQHELRTLRYAISRCRWLALGHALGVTRILSTGNGQSAPVALQMTRRSLRRSPWTFLGRRLGLVPRELLSQEKT